MCHETKSVGVENTAKWMNVNDLIFSMILNVKTWNIDQNIESWTCFASTSAYFLGLELMPKTIDDFSSTREKSATMSTKDAEDSYELKLEEEVCKYSEDNDSFRTQGVK